MRVEGYREFGRVFGDLYPQSSFPHSIRGYFENGGQVAHVVRVLPDDERHASGEWVIGKRDEMGKWSSNFPTSGRFRSAKYRITATSPGTWAQGLRVIIKCDLNGPGGTPILSMTVHCEGEAIEHISPLVPGETGAGKTLEELVASQSVLIRVEAVPPEDPSDRLTDGHGEPLVDRNGFVRTNTKGAPLIELPEPPGPQSLDWDVVLDLPGGPDSNSPPQASVVQEYRKAVVLLSNQSEVAILAAPSIYTDLPNSSAQHQVFRTMIDEAVETQDRLVLIDPPPPTDEADDAATNSNDVISFVDELRDGNPTPTARRAAAVYHPWLRVNNPSDDVTQPFRTVPPSGHVAGVMSRIDRERGAHHTPANVPVLDAIDVVTAPNRDASGTLAAANINLIRCMPGRGLMAWGGRTLDFTRHGRFVAHRRFIHRLIRAIRRVAAPNVFETNEPELWLILIRGVTTILLEAFRGGALQGLRPEEAFRVRCDEHTNPLSDREQGRVLCEIDLALAAPMEFITIRVLLSRDGQVEVFDE